MSGTSGPGPEWLYEHLDRWVERGIVTAEQARSIASYEGVEPAAGAPGRQPQARKLTLLAEGVSYLGIALMTASGALVSARFWEDLHVGGRLAIGLVMIAAGFAAAAVVGRIDDQGARRLASFLQLFGTGGVALTAGVITVAVASDDAVTALAVGLAVLLTSTALWRNLERVLPFLGALTGLVVSVLGLYGVGDWSSTTTQSALTAWGAALALGVLGATGRLHPVLPALLVAEIGSLIAALVVVNPHHAFGLILGLITALAALFAGMGLKHVSVEAIGVIGCLVFLGYALGLYVKGPAGAISIMVLGAVLVSLAIRAGLHHKGPPPSPHRHRHPRIP